MGDTGPDFPYSEFKELCSYLGVEYNFYNVQPAMVRCLEKIKNNMEPLDKDSVKPTSKSTSNFVSTKDIVNHLSKIFIEHYGD